MADCAVLPHAHVDMKNIRVWMEESIWGHRLYDDQSPWLALLEFLNVFRSRGEGALQEPVTDDAHETVVYDMERMRAVRYLVFNNPHLRRIEQTTASESERWRLWLDHVAGNTLNIDFSYLQPRFGDFSELCRVVEFFQETAVQVQTNKRWTSRFLFPYGPGCLYADLDGSGEFLGSNDRRFFARGGELLYLMLNRSARATEVAKAVRTRLLDADARWNRLVRVLVPDGQEKQKEQIGSVKAGYLPCRRLEDYDRLAEDWLAVLSLALPGQSLLDPLMRLTGLNMILYILSRARAVTGEAETRLVLEITAPRRSPVLDLSADNADANRHAPRRAVIRKVQDIRETDEWKAACAHPDPRGAALDLLKSRFYWMPRESEEIKTAQWALDALEEDVLKRHDGHFAKVLPGWARSIGLATARRGVGTWYSPSDSLIRALVMATVQRQEEFNIFLARLYERYRIVIGVAEAERSYDTLPVDAQAFRDNAERLEHRMRTLGMVRRLSDDCAYVINPFAGDER